MKAYRLYSIVVAALIMFGAADVFAQDNLEKRFALGPGDRIEISVWREETLEKIVFVRPDGKISFPLIGDIQAEGRTVDELREVIQERISEYVPDSPVSVILDNLGSSRVFVIGKVARPGAIPLSGEMRILQALSVSGGLTTFASEGGIKLIREENGGQALYEFDYADVSKGKRLEQNLLLQSGDTIIVP
jgi:polysaccharide export outer membrane protein